MKRAARGRHPHESNPRAFVQLDNQITGVPFDRERVAGAKFRRRATLSLQLDPGYARAWVGLSLAHDAQADRDLIPLDEGRREARREVEKALGLDPNLAEAHAALGRMRGLYDWDWSGATAAYKRALELGPGNATVVLGLAGQAATLGHLEEALRLDRRAIEMDPLNGGGTSRPRQSCLARRPVRRGGSRFPQGSRPRPRPGRRSHQH